MTDDTTTWLKKNPIINPLRRSLKTSLRFHVNTAEMDGSIISNAGNIKSQQLVIPRMLQRPSLGSKKFMEGDFKVPRKSIVKKEKNNTSKPSVRAGAERLQSRKSYLPIVKCKVPSAEKNSSSGSLTRPSFFPKSSGRKTTKRELIRKFVQASINANAIASSQKKNLLEPIDDSSIIRSILKKNRNSRRRSSQISDQIKPKAAKKVLFEGLENSQVQDKENDINTSNIKDDSYCDFAPLDEPTVFLNFPKSSSSPMKIVNKSTDGNERGNEDKNDENSTEPEVSSDSNNLTQILTMWKNYSENFKNLESMRDTLETSFQVYLEQSLTFHTKFNEYLKTTKEMYGQLTKLKKEVEDKIKNSVATGEKNSEFSINKRNPLEKETRKKFDKIKMSDRSKVIKRTSGKLHSGAKSIEWVENENDFKLIKRIP